MSRAPRILAVLALSAGTLAYQILLVRVFAIEQFHHLATMAVGVAMLGIGAAGTAFSLAHVHGRAAPDRWFAWSALLTAAGLVLSPLAAGLVQVDPAALAWDARQWIRLAWIYLVLAAPFALGALAVLAALALSLDRPGALYGASLVGSGLGAAVALLPLWVLSPMRAITVPAVIASLGAVCAARYARRPRHVGVAAVVIALVAVVLVARPPRATPRLLPYKGLAQVLAYPEARITAERTTPVGWLVAVDAPAFRYLPGLSLAYRGGFPAQTGLFVDGEPAGAVTRWDRGNVALLDWQPASLPYALGPRGRVLVLGGTGGLAVAGALHAGAREVTAVDLQPDVVALLRASARDGPLDLTRVQWVTASPRTYTARSDRRYDLITLGPSAGTPGAATGTLREDFDHTVEAYRRYLDLLDDGGLLAVTAWVAVPPRGEVRTVLTAAEALRRLAPGMAPRSLAVVRSWGTVTVLVKPDGFTEVQLAALEFWAADRLFDVEWRPGLGRPQLRHNLVEQPVVFDAARAGTGGAADAERFIAGYPLDVRPATDHRPYPHHFVGFRAVGWMLERARGDWLPFAEWGHLALLVTLMQSALLAALLMGVPAAARTGRPAGPAPGRLLGYFAAIGVGFLAAEIAAIQQLTLLLGHPVYAVAAVLAGLLVASGLGSLLSDRRPPAHARPAALLLAVLLVAYAMGLLPLVQWLQPASPLIRSVAAVVVLAPAALLMGAPFPLGVRAVAGPEPGRVAWAWAANGFASVVTAPAAALIALDAGHRVVFVVAAAAYAVAAVLAGRAGAAPERPPSESHR